MTPEEKMQTLVDGIRLGMLQNPRRIALMRAILQIPDSMLPWLMEVAELIKWMAPAERVAMRAAMDVAWPLSSSAAGPPTSSAAKS